MSPDFYEWIQSDPSDVRSKMVADYSVAPDGDQDFHVGYYPLKYPGNAGASVPAYVNNVKVIRLSEVYLIAAEAALKVPAEASNAAGYINDLRKQRITGYTDAASVTIDEILDERRKELFAEGHIAFDYWRNGKNVVKGSLTTAPTDTKTVLPIPKEEIDLAKGKLKQNPGYGN